MKSGVQMNLLAACHLKHAQNCALCIIAVAAVIQATTGCSSGGIPAAAGTLRSNVFSVCWKSDAWSKLEPWLQFGVDWLADGVDGTAPSSMPSKVRVNRKSHAWFDCELQSGHGVESDLGARPPYRCTLELFLVTSGSEIETFAFLDRGVTTKMGAVGPHRDRRPRLPVLPANIDEAKRDRARRD